MKQDIEVASRIEREKIMQELHVAYKIHKDDKHYIISSAAIQKYAVPLFKAGAEWRINSVWHNVREKPDKGKLLIVEDIDSAYDLVYLTKSKPWEELSEKDHYMRWAYIEDLLPCEEERG